MSDAPTESAPEATARPDPALPPQWRRALRGAYIAPLLVLLSAATAVATQFKVTSHEGFAQAGYTFAIAALGLGVAAFAARRPHSSEPADMRALAPVRLLEVAFVLAVIGLAAFFRFHRFAEFPPGLWYDEAVNGTDAFSIIDQDHLTVWRDTNFGHSTIYFYLLIASFKLFGYTVFAMRLVPALAGLAAVVAFYFLARWLVGVVPALVATALLAVSRFAVTFSRISWEASLEPLLEIMAVLFFVKGLESRNKFYFLLAGGSLAAGLYTYLAFRIVPVIMLFFLVYVAVTQWSLIRRNMSGLTVYALSFLIVVMPLAQFALQNQDKFLARTRDVSVFKEIEARDSYAPLRENIEKSAKLINVRGDINGRHNLPRAPMVDEITAALVVLGLAVAIWSARDWRKGAMAGWLALALVPGVFTITIENPSMIRAVGAIPPVYMLAALAVGQAHRTLTPTLAGRVVFALLAVGIVGGATVLNYRDFFERQAKDRDVYDAFTPGFTDIAKVVARESDDKQVYVNVEHIGHPAIRVLGRGKEFQPYLPVKDLILNSEKGDGVLLMTPKQFGMIPTLQRLYPNLRRKDDVDPFGRVFFSTLTIPAADMDALHEVQLAISHAALDEAPVVTSRSAVARSWTEEDLANGPLTAVWEGYLWVRTFPGAASFSVQSPGTVSIEIDGEAVALNEDGSPSAPVNLTYGERRLRVVARIDRPGDTSIGYAIDGTETTLARAAYGISTGASGFQAIFRDGVEFVAEPAILTHIPFALGVSVARNFQAVEYRGTFDTSLAGDYRYALEGASSSQVYIDDQLIIDNGGAHGSRRVEGTATLTTGEHLMTITYLAGDIADWAVYVRDPDADFRQLDGSEFRPPTGEYKPPVLAVVRADPVWGSLGQPVDGLEIAPNGIAALPDGTIVIGYGKTLAFADRVTGRITRSVIIDADAIVDIAAGPDGRIVVLDSQRRSLILLSEDGEEQRRIDAAFQSASGVAVRDNTAYVASAAGGLIYAVPLDTLEPEVISGKPEDFVPGEERAQQPSDVVVGDDGTVYANDFERVRVLAYREGKVVSSFPGVTGSGGQVPRMAFHRGLILITDPQNTRLVVYDVGGRLRGAFTFQLQEKVARVIGIEATDDGSIFVAAAERGVIFRLRLEISPELEALIGAP